MVRLRWLWRIPNDKRRSRQSPAPAKLQSLCGTATFRYATSEDYYRRESGTRNYYL